MTASNIKRIPIVIVTIIFLITYFFILTGSTHAFCRLTDTSNMDAFFGKFAMTEDIYTSSKYHVIYDEEVFNPNFINTNRRLVAAAENRIWYEDI